MSKVYSHIGHDQFYKEMFMPIKNIPMFVKPHGGFWGSPLDTAQSWSAFVEQENFGKSKYKSCGFKFKLENAKVLTITNAQQLKDLPHQKDNDLFGMKLDSLFDQLDYEELSKTYDAIEVYVSKDYELYERLYGWDVDSVLVMNPDVVKMI